MRCHIHTWASIAGYSLSLMELYPRMKYYQICFEILKRNYSRHLLVFDFLLHPTYRKRNGQNLMNTQSHQEILQENKVQILLYWLLKSDGGVSRSSLVKGLFLFTADKTDGSFSFIILCVAWRLWNECFKCRGHCALQDYKYFWKDTNHWKRYVKVYREKK